ncbi:kinase-like domain-containing protein [Leptodontidium sp. 2 PMI_412]|nr:kinase-like domain-containing protein [Leptodontidium sp. 2 PMI_412]
MILVSSSFCYSIETNYFEMEDSNTIAWLSPTEPEHKDIDTWKAIRMNISEDIPPQVSGYRSRESTAPLEDEEDNNPEHTSYPQLHLAFNSGLKCGHGLMFGTDPNSCDVVLPRLRRISNRHCYLTFDAERRLILRDCSTYGTIVEYDHQGGHLRRHFTWILGGHEVPQETKNIVIEIQGVSFRIKVSRHDADPDQYNANVDRFLEEANEPHLNGLGIYSPTAPSSQSHTPTQGPIRLKRETLGKGAFAVVRRFWDVSTGLEYAYKEPLNKRKFDEKLWEKEAEIMGQISHDHVVRLEEFVFTPSPRLVLEYVPFGTLEGLELSLEQSMTVLCQGLSALADLHGRKIPIVHRDIKPGNILLQSRDPPFIKFTDFGLSKASDSLKTFCGTRLYLAPEVYQRKKYTPAVDIWSFGLVVYQCAFGGLPSKDDYREEDWCELLVAEVNDWEEGDLIDLLSSTMIIMDPKLRRSAQHCYREASRLIASYERCLTPTPASYATEGQAVGGVNLHTSSNVQNYSQHKDSPSAFYPSDSKCRYIRSDAPPPSSTNSLQHVQSVPGIDLFGENWLQDPNCVGSSVAAMGQESSDLESWDRWSAASGGDVPRTTPEPVYEQNEYHNPPLGSEDNTFTQSTYHINTGGQGGRNWGQNIEVAQTDSEGYLAARLLYQIHQEGT